MPISFQDVVKLNCGNLRLTIKKKKTEKLVLENESFKGNGYVTFLVFMHQKV